MGLKGVLIDLVKSVLRGKETSPEVLEASWKFLGSFLSWIGSQSTALSHLSISALGSSERYGSEFDADLDYHALKTLVQEGLKPLPGFRFEDLVALVNAAYGRLSAELRGSFPGTSSDMARRLWEKGDQE